MCETCGMENGQHVDGCPETPVRCPDCGSENVESHDFPSFGGTTEGYEECGDCGKTFNGWADLSAVK